MPIAHTDSAGTGAVERAVEVRRAPSRRLLVVELHRCCRSLLRPEANPLLLPRQRPRRVARVVSEPVARCGAEAPRILQRTDRCVRQQLVSSDGEAQQEEHRRRPPPRAHRGQPSVPPTEADALRGLRRRGNPTLRLSTDRPLQCRSLRQGPRTTLRPRGNPRKPLFSWAPKPPHHLGYHTHKRAAARLGLACAWGITCRAAPNILLRNCMQTLAL